MTPRFAVALALLAAPACYDPSPPSGGGGTAGATDTSAPTVTDSDDTSLETGLSGCSNDEECVDVDPCSIDTCENDSCTHAPNVDDPACACTGAADCTQLPTDDECRTRTCIDGVCGLAFTAADTPLQETAQTAEDCRLVVCDGAGNTASIDDDADVPVDGLECTNDECAAGTPLNSPVDSGTSCGTAGTCNARGDCIGCDTPADCGGESTQCEVVTCVDEVCGIELTPDGTVLPEQTAGDCQRQECDGRGNAASVADDEDTPADEGNDCTDDSCESGVVVHPSLPSDNACNSDGGNVCDGDGSCVECNSNAQCGGGDACNTAVCAGGQCSLSPNTAAACDDGQFCTAVDTCNANGTCVGAGDPCPGADGDFDCSEGCNETSNDCSGIDPVNSPCNDGAFCTANDACNGAGSCVGTGNPCPGADGDADCSETCNEAADACTGNDPNNTDCGGCSRCQSGSCQYQCNAIAQCCPGDDICISQGQECP